MIPLLVALLIGHVVADTIFQPSWLSTHKYNRDPVVASQALAIHGAVHALPVALVTGTPLLAALEMVLHPLIDLAKARGWYGIKTDQALHVACKFAWVALTLW